MRVRASIEGSLAALFVAGVVMAGSVVVSPACGEGDHPDRRGEPDHSDRRGDQSILEGRIVYVQPEPTLRAGRATQFVTVEIERVVIGPPRRGTVVLVIAASVRYRLDADRSVRRGFVLRTLHDEDPYDGRDPCQFDGDDDDPRDTALYGVLGRASRCKGYEQEHEEVVVALSPSYWSVGSRVSIAVTGSGFCFRQPPIQNAALKGLPQICAGSDNLFLINDEGYIVDGDLR